MWRVGGWNRWMWGAAVLAGACMVALLRPDPAPEAGRGAWGEATAPPRPERPAEGVDVPSGAVLQDWIDGAAAGSVLRLAAGEYAGPVVVGKPMTIWGPREAVIRAPARDSAIRVEGSGVRLLGFTVDGGPARPGTPDASVRVVGDDVVVQGLLVRGGVHGILVHQSRRVQILDNEAVGDPRTPLGLRGDGIRLWETRDSVVEGNRVRHCRDVLLQYSPHNRVVGNIVEHGRYGAHFMYSSDAVVRGNRLLHNTVGVFVMYSSRIEVSDNLLAGAVDHGGMGVGLKESGDVSIVGNAVVRNQSGVYLDASPFRPTQTLRVEDNLVAINQAGVVFLSSATRGVFRGNEFRGNQEQVRIEGGGDALAVEWLGNDFDDYRGYDLDRNGTGDVPYELCSASGRLVAQRPELALFRGTAALGLLEAMGRAFPLLAPRPILVDAEPRRIKRAW